MNILDLSERLLSIVSRVHSIVVRIVHLADADIIATHGINYNDPNQIINMFVAWKFLWMKEINSWSGIFLLTQRRQILKRLDSQFGKIVYQLITAPKILE